MASFTAPTSADRNCRADADGVRAAAEGCAESRLLMSRRAMLGVSAGLFSWACMPRFAEAATSDARLLVVVLRGGMDGINTVVPFGDSSYVSMRGSLALPAASTIPLDGFFGLHPALQNFGALYQARQAAVVNATCVPLRNRSHFDTQDNLENGLSGKTTACQTGWLNRLLSVLPASAPIKSAGAIQIGEAPLILRGPAPVLGWSPTWFSDLWQPTCDSVRSLYRDQDRQMWGMLERGLKANGMASSASGADGDIGSLRKGFRGAGRLLAAADGPRIAVLCIDGWDTHTDQGGAHGLHADLLAELDTAISDFRSCVGSAWQNTLMVCATEFGRTVRINGDGGTDHGVGTVTLLAGGAVNGGKVFGDWPGLAPGQLYEGSDLRPTTDLRSVFKGILRDHLGVPTNMLNNTIFPASTGALPLSNLVKGSGSQSTIRASAPSAASMTVEAPIAKYRRALAAAHVTAN
jgi:uncharacterized protein (DUF1501 family)